MQHDTHKVCAACGTSVARQDCHKNRFGEYICRNCQAAGIRFTRQSRVWSWVRRALRRSAWGLVGTALILVVLALLFLFSR